MIAALVMAGDGMSIYLACLKSSALAGNLATILYSELRFIMFHEPMT